MYQVECLKIPEQRKNIFIFSYCPFKNLTILYVRDGTKLNLHDQFKRWGKIHGKIDWKTWKNLEALWVFLFKKSRFLLGKLIQKL